MAKKLEFGRQPPKKAKVAWGARAIFKPNTRAPMIDILFDRQDAFGDVLERQALVDWVSTTGLSRIEAEIDEKAGSDVGRSNDVFRFEDARYVIEASPQRSHGYLYIGAWKK